MQMRRFVLMALLSAVPGLGHAQDPPAQDPPAGGGRGGRAAEAEIRPYDRVITKDAKSDDGVFTVHRIKDRIYYEIPKAQLGQRVPLGQPDRAGRRSGAGYGGQAAGNRVVRWERRGDRILLRAVSYDVVADSAAPIAKAVEAANYSPIVWPSTSKRSARTMRAVIEVTRLFTTDVPEFSGRTRVGARAFDASRVVRRARVSFPENIEIEATHTYNNPPEQAPAGGRGAPAPGGGRGAAPLRPGSAQRADALQHGDAAREADDAAPVRRARRLLLGPSDRLRPGRAPLAAAPVHHPLAAREEGPDAALSEPVKPIVYYDRPGHAGQVGALHEEGHRELAAGVRGGRLQERRSSRRKRRRPSRSGLESRRRALLRHPLAAVDDRERLGPARAATRAPARSSRADIQFYHNVMNLASDWYFVQVGPLDPRAKTLPLPDDLMGRLIEYVVAHEVGHTLGFQHNMKASSMYSGGQGARSRVGQEDGPHADADGLLALQLRRAARGQHRRRRSRPRHRAVRQVGDDVGLQADPRRHARRTTRRRRSTNGRAQQDATP